MNVMSQRIIQPPVTECHFFAAGARKPKMRSLYTRNSIPRTKETRRAMTAAIRWGSVRDWKVLRSWRCTL